MARPRPVSFVRRIPPALALVALALFLWGELTAPTTEQAASPADSTPASILAPTAKHTAPDRLEDAGGALSGPFTWVKLFDEGSDSALEAIAADDRGNVVVTGRAGSGATIVVAKLDEAGAVEWERHLGKGTGTGVTFDREGRVAVTGVREEQADGDAGEKRRPFVALLDASGAVVWSHPMDGDDAPAIAAHAGGFLGITRSYAQGRVISTLTQEDARGNVEWTRRLGSDADRVYAETLAIDRAGNVIVGGHFDGPGELGGAPLRAARMSAGAFVVKLDAAGAHLWSKRVGGVDDRLAPARVAIDGADDVFVLAMEEDELTTAANLPPTDLVLLELDPHGRELTRRRFLHDLWGTGIAVDAAGSVLITGTFAGAIDFGNGVLRGRGDAFAALFGASGGVAWASNLGARRGVVALTAHGKAVMTGRTGGYDASAHYPFVGAIAPRSPADDAPPGGAPPMQKRARAVSQFFRLDATSGTAGRLEAVLDARITKEDREFACFSWEPGLGLGPGFDSPPSNAELRIMGEGKVLDSIGLRHPTARVEAWKLHGGGKVTYHVSVNDGICMGSRRGWVSTLFEVEGGKLHQVQAVGPDGESAMPIEMVSSLWGAFRVVPARSGAGKDVLYARNHDAEGPAGFNTTFVRFSFDGTRWVRHEREAPGLRYLEETNSFPARAEFP